MKKADLFISIPFILLIVSIILKICNIIKWNWTWVLAPFWIYLILYVIIMFIWEYFTDK